MRLWKILLLIGSIAVLTIVFFINNSTLKSNESVMEKENQLETKQIPHKKVLSEQFTGPIFDMIGKSTNELEEEFGDPIRKDKSAYGYVWWVYPDEESYLQFGVEDEKVVTIYGTGDIQFEPVTIGKPYKDLNEELDFSKEVTYQHKLNSYQFRLSKEEIKSKPLVQVTDHIFMQLYFDIFTNKLSSIRVLTGDVLLKHRPYEIKYRGQLPEELNLTEEQWEKIEKGMEQQIFDITNQFRKNHQINGLEWDETVRKVAYLHSKDMENEQYFSHYGLDGSGLKERLRAEDVFYVAAGENIAALYPDAPSAMAGWLNSKGHREALLNKEYTHLGVGVYRMYYTQNFLENP